MADSSADTALGPPPDAPAGRRLDSWKEIAAYLKRDIKTVQRWEKREALPVHRHHHDKLGSVYAYTSQLDAWLSGRRLEFEQRPALEQERAEAEPASASPDLGTVARSSKPYVWPLVLAILGLAVAAPGYLWLVSRDAPAAGGIEVRSLAVLPFRPLPSAAREESLELGMADALITRLSNVRALTVRPLSAVLKFRDGRDEVQSAGRQLRVDSVLEGKVQLDGDRLRVTVQMIRVRDGTPLFAERFDERFTDGVFAVQDSIAERVTQALMLKLSGDEKSRLTKRHTHSTEAYQRYVRGRYFVNQRKEAGYTKAIDYFEQAVQIDPNYALAYAGLADAYSLLGVFVTSAAAPNEVFPQARTAATKALGLDESLAEAHASLAYTKLVYDWDWPGAEQGFKRAIASNPNYATAHQWQAHYFAAMGRPDDAIAAINRARDLDPVSLTINRGVGRHLYFRRQYDRAIEQERQTLELDPSFAVARYSLGLAYVQKGMFREAISELQQAIPASQENPVMIGALGHAYARSGNRLEALKLVQKLKELSRHRYVSPYNIAFIYTGLADRDAAFEWLGKAYQERTTALVFLNVEPAFDLLRTDTRFLDLIRRIGLPPPSD